MTILPFYLLSFSRAISSNNIGQKLKLERLGNNLQSPSRSIKRYIVTKMTILPFSFLYLLVFPWAISSNNIGVNFGLLGNNLPSPSRPIKLYTVTKMTILPLSFLCLIFPRVMSDEIGINFGRLGNNLPSPSRSIELLKTLKAGRVKLYDANPEILRLLSGTNLEVMIMVANDEISAIAKSQELANRWIIQNVLSYYPETMIRCILVGNEVLSFANTDQNTQITDDLVPAMERIRDALEVVGINNINIGTPLAMDIVQDTFPPSNGRFKPDIVHAIVRLLEFLREVNSIFFVDVYPYFPWAGNPNNINLDYALLEGTQTYVDPGSGLTYTNLLDQMVDSVVFAMAKLGYNDVMVGVAETGWPHEGGSGASRENAAVYNRNIVKRMTTVPPKGTPARPGVVIPTYIFSLYDENEKDGPESERHWGLLHPDGSPVYEVDLSGKEY